MTPDADPETRERLSADDEAQRTAETFVADALAHHRRARERAGEQARPGVCTNCGEACLPTAIYCDVDCRADHEARLRVHRWPAGGARG